MQKYAIIDIETTGANRSGNKITEIAIIITDEHKILETYETLINPERSIPPNITYLTGITNEMVMDKPKFYEVAKKIVEKTQDCIFIAHNVFFDYNFIRSEFNELGYSFNRKKLCTVRLSRKAFPGLPSYALKNLTRNFNIPLKNHHRAMADANATLELFRLIKEKEPKLLQETLEDKPRITTLPPHFDKDQLDHIPESPGLYYFYAKDGELLYIGKSKNIKKRIMNHFRPDIKRKKDLQLKYKISRIETQVLGNELAALLKESHEIKHFKPPFNIALKASRFIYKVIIKKNSQGVPELKITTHDEDQEMAFKSKSQAKRAIEKFLKDTFGIADHEYFESALNKYFKVLGEVEYLKKLSQFNLRYTYPQEDFFLKLKGRTKLEDCFITVRNNQLDELVFKSDENTESFKLQENRDHRLILLGHMVKYNLNPLVGKLTLE